MNTKDQEQEVLDTEPSEEDLSNEEEENAQEETVQPSKMKVPAGEMDATRLYLKDIEQSVLLSADEEKFYTRKAQAGCESSRHKMIESNLRLVVRIARRYMNRGLTLIDLIEEGNLGLIHAVEKFDPDRGFRFSTYGSWWIRQSIERGLMNQTRTIRVPIHVMKEMNALLKAERRLKQELDHEPTFEDIAKHTEKPLADVELILGQRDRVISLHSTNDKGQERSLLETVADEANPEPGTAIEGTFVNNIINQCFDLLEPRQKDVLTLRFALDGGEKASLEEIGDALGITKERVRQIQMAALKDLRIKFEMHGYGSDVLSED